MKCCIKTPGLLEASLRLRLRSWARRPSGTEESWPDHRSGPGATRAGPWGGQAGRGQQEVRGTPTTGPPSRDSGAHPGARSPHLCPGPPPLRPSRSMASDPRYLQLQPLVGRRRHPAPPPPSSSFRLPRPAPPPRLQLYR